MVEEEEVEEEEVEEQEVGKTQQDHKGGKGHKDQQDHLTPLIITFLDYLQFPWSQSDRMEIWAA